MRLALSLSPLLLSAQTLTAQTPTPGVMTGSVRDSSGAPIANAAVFVIGTAFSALTNKAGHYLIRNLPPGEMVDIRAAYVGFRPVRTDSVQIRTDGPTVVDFQLASGGADIYPVVSFCECPQISRDLNSTRWIISGWMLGQ